MNSIICTLFEGHYHLGAAALINSLSAHNYSGDIFIGYRGALPPWALKLESITDYQWEGAKLFKPTASLDIHFLPLETTTHFTNYKPTFILKVWHQCLAGKNVPGIFYFDPDIVNTCEWSFYETWIKYGVAMIHEIVWNDMPSNHPKRRQWLDAVQKMNLQVNHKLHSYLNAGFFGVNKDNIRFLILWEELLDFCEHQGLFDKTLFAQSDNDYGLFKVGDQDLFNLAAMLTDCPLSEFGPEGMDFTGGGWLMSHATGSPKPWKTNYLVNWIKGRNPTRSSKKYWKYANGIIKPYSKSALNKKEYAQKAAALLGRLYSK